MVISIVEGDVSSAEAIGLLRDHLQGMADHSPPASIHALELERLSAPDITFLGGMGRC